MSKTKTKKTEPQTIPVMPDWKNQFRSAHTKVGFQLHLSRAMLEMLCATADDTQWDRSSFGDVFYPDNWVATERSLTKRGLVVRKTAADRGKQLDAITAASIVSGEFNERSFIALTPAGEALVQLLKTGGLFIESDAAISKKSRKSS